VQAKKFGSFTKANLLIQIGVGDERPPQLFVLSPKSLKRAVDQRRPAALQGYELFKYPSGRY
jgi:hypothetical protein